jgi:hypothetical protein
LPNDRQFVFTMSTGRSGTAYLTELLGANTPDVESHHEFLGWRDFGLNTPDVTHLALFNAEGNVEKVQTFWRHKHSVVLNSRARCYVETAHVLMKAGLVENIAPLASAGHVHLVDLQRDVGATIRSFRARYDFFNKGDQWFWYLDEAYPRNLCSFEKFSKYGHSGLCLWYITEIRLRAAYYARLVKTHPNITVHRVRLEDIARPEGALRFLADLGVSRSRDQLRMPPPQNVGSPALDMSAAETDLLNKLVAAAQFDADTLADAAIRQGLNFDPK